MSSPYSLARGGGRNLVDVGFGDVPLFRSTVVLKSVELLASVFKYVQNNGNHLIVNTELLVLLLEKYCKTFKNGRGHKKLFDDFVVL